jgi:hypothetical protein
MLPGQSVVVQFEVTGGPAAVAPAGSAATPWVPRSAVLQRGELTAVYVAQRDGFALRSVRTGLATTDGRVPVWAGLRPGEQIAADAVRAGLAGATPAR